MKAIKDFLNWAFSPIMISRFIALIIITMSFMIFVMDFYIFGGLPKVDPNFLFGLSLLLSPAIPFCLGVELYKKHSKPKMMIATMFLFVAVLLHLRLFSLWDKLSF